MAARKRTRRPPSTQRLPALYPLRLYITGDGITGRPSPAAIRLLYLFPPGPVRGAAAFRLPLGPMMSLVWRRGGGDTHGDPVILPLGAWICGRFWRHAGKVRVSLNSISQLLCEMVSKPGYIFPLAYTSCQPTTRRVRSTPYTKSAGPAASLMPNSRFRSCNPCAAALNPTSDA